jgi:large subunit ribosomal protein L9
MDVILLEKMHRLGNLGDTVSVKAGYGRNYLIPSKKAVAATDENVARFEERRAGLEQAQAEILSVAEARKVALDDIEVVISANAGPEGKLFGSVGAAEIAAAAAACGVEVGKSEIRLHDGPLRELGEFSVEVYLNTDVSGNIKVTIVQDAGESTS